MNAQRHPRPYYYVENFSVALTWLGARYDDLLSAEERAFMSAFERLPRESQGLLVRMLMRQGDLFRTSKLSYAEIGCPQRAAEPLLDHGWVDSDPRISLTELCRLLRKPELWSAFGMHGPTRALRKTELVQLVSSQAVGAASPTAAIPASPIDPAQVANLAHPARPANPVNPTNLGSTANPENPASPASQPIEDAHPLHTWWSAAPDRVFKVLIAPLCERLRRMFFGNFRQTWAEFVLADLGIFRYETVPLDANARAFQSRAQIEQFEALYRCRELLHADAPPEEAAAAVPPPLLGCSWIEARRAQLRFRIGQAHERAQSWSAAIASYEDSHYPEARIRAIRVRERIGQAEEALALAANLQQTSPNEYEQQHVERILVRLRRRIESRQPLAHGRARRGAAATRPPRTWEQFDLRVPAPLDGKRVEQLAAEAIAMPDAPVIYVENALINSLFGLLCWDAVFAPVAGAFFHPFHAAPSDLFEPDFEARRRTHFTSCFEQLGTGRYADTIRNTFERKSGIQSPFVAWGMITQELLDLALTCIPAAHLRACFQRLLADLRENRCGLPDLIQFWPQEHRYRLVEVKGPGDRLQDNQIRWLRFCAAQGVPVSVCHVSWRIPVE